MELEITKPHSYTFHPTWAKLYDKYGSHRGIQSYGYFGDLQKNKKKKIVAL